MEIQQNNLIQKTKGINSLIISLPETGSDEFKEYFFDYQKRDVIWLKLTNLEEIHNIIDKLTDESSTGHDLISPNLLNPHSSLCYCIIFYDDIRTLIDYVENLLNLNFLLRWK